jgi:hypothetical protein
MSSTRNMQPKSTNAKLSMISMPGIPTNQAHYRKTLTKLRWALALEGGYCHGVVQTLLVILLDLGKDLFKHCHSNGHFHGNSGCPGNQPKY